MSDEDALQAILSKDPQLRALKQLLANQTDIARKLEIQVCIDDRSKELSEFRN